MSEVHQRSILEEVLVERKQQDLKWGEQNHPSIYPVLQGLPQNLICAGYEIPTEDRAKHLCDEAARHEKCTWAHIAVEELCEAVGAPDDIKRREELVQLLAVTTAWIECIDRRATTVTG